MRTAVSLLGLLATAPAYAGGVGIIGNAGVHSENVYWYSTKTLDGGEEIADPANYEQVRQNQSLLNAGGGLEFLLGDRDERIQGVFRLYYNFDTAQTDPSEKTSLAAPEDIISAHRAEARHTGMATMGLNWGIIGNTSNFQLGLSAHIGSGFLTNDHTEFFIAQVGPTVNYRFARSAVLFADITYAVRFRKEFSQGNLNTVGIRYMFD